MLSPNPMKEALSSGRFSYMVEMVASARTAEAKIFEQASDLARIPGLVAAGITSYAGGSAGHDPVRVGAGVKARGLTPNVHVTCVNRDRLDILRSLEDLHALGIENVFAISGDYPVADKTTPPLWQMDSVQLIEMISELRAAGMPFHVSCAVSPFKYTEPDCVYQYLKLEKKIKAGADFAITQLGYDSKKYRELKQYMNERGLKTPIFGNAYILPPKAAEKFAKGEPPGCWVSPELLERIQEEAKAPDKGMAARLERAAQTVAILRGLGYAGAYIGGSHEAERVKWIIQRSEEIAGQWEEFAAQSEWGAKGGFYYFDQKPAPPKPRGFVPNTMDAVGKMFPVNKGGPLQDMMKSIFTWVDKRPSTAHAVERLEFAMKSPMFGCQACGNCVLGQMEYVCPMTCPKNMRNGPCGGTLMGQCEVYPDKPCIWVSVYERAKAANEIDYLRTYIPPRLLSLKGTSSWINYFLNRDSRPGNDTNPNPAALVQINKAPDASYEEVLAEKKSE
jgi:methylenetetrahydrofolate reductase (NADPH)